MRKFLIFSLLITFLFTFVSPIYSAQSLSTKSRLLYIMMNQHRHQHRNLLLLQNLHQNLLLLQLRIQGLSN